MCVSCDGKRGNKDKHDYMWPQWKQSENIHTHTHTRTHARTHTHVVTGIKGTDSRSDSREAQATCTHWSPLTQQQPLSLRDRHDIQRAKKQLRERTTDIVRPTSTCWKTEGGWRMREESVMWSSKERKLCEKVGDEQKEQNKQLIHVEKKQTGVAWQRPTYEVDQ